LARIQAAGVNGFVKGSSKNAVRHRGKTGGTCAEAVVKTVSATQTGELKMKAKKRKKGGPKKAAKKKTAKKKTAKKKAKKKSAKKKAKKV
jgi:hypothetical protein